MFSCLPLEQTYFLTLDYSHSSQQLLQSTRAVSPNSCSRTVQYPYQSNKLQVFLNGRACMCHLHGYSAIWTYFIDFYLLVCELLWSAEQWSWWRKLHAHTAGICGVWSPLFVSKDRDALNKDIIRLNWFWTKRSHVWTPLLLLLEMLLVVTPLCLYLQDETLWAVCLLYLVSGQGEVKIPLRQ